MNRREMLTGAAAAAAAAVLPKAAVAAAVPALVPAGTITLMDGSRPEPGYYWVIYATGGMLLAKPPGGEPQVIGTNDGNNSIGLKLGEVVDIKLESKGWYRIPSPTKPDDADDV